MFRYPFSPSQYRFRYLGSGYRLRIPSTDPIPGCVSGYTAVCVLLALYELIKIFYGVLIYIYIYICVCVCGGKISACDSFFQFNALKIFYAINAGAGLGLATPLTTAVSVTISLDKKCIYSVAERLYDHIKRETFQMHAPASQTSQTSAQTVLCSVFYCTHKD